METNSALNYLDYSLKGQNIDGAFTVNTPTTAWNYWTDYYYPQVIRESYPIYIQERAKDSGKQAFEIIKALQDKDLIKLDKVKDFVEAMDILIKIL